MSNEQDAFQFEEFIGTDKGEWERYKEEYGSEAYKYRRLYEEVVRQIQNLYQFAEQQGIELPSPGDSGSL